MFAAKQAVIDGLRLPGDDGLRPEAHLFRGVNPSSDALSGDRLWPNEDRRPPRSLAQPSIDMYIKIRFTIDSRCYRVTPIAVSLGGPPKGEP